MTRWHSVSFSLGLVVLAPDQALAGPKQCDPKYPAHCEQRLAKGEAAAFAGHLLSPKLSISLGLKADDCQAYTDVYVRYARRDKDLDISLLKDLRQNDETRHQLEMDAVQADRDRWKELADTPFYEKPWFVTTITAVVVGAIFVGVSQIPGR